MLLPRRALAVGITLAVASSSAMLALLGSEASAQQAADAPTVSSLASLIEHDLHFGMSHAEVTDVYNKINGLFDREYAPQLAHTAPGIGQQQLEADRENRKTNFARSLTLFQTDPTGYDVSALHVEYTYNNGEAIQKLFKDGKNRYFFYIKDRFWKLYDEVPLRDGGVLGSTFQEASSKLGAILGTAGRVRAAGTAGLSSSEVDWQDGSMHLRLVDRSREHIAGLVLEDKNTLRNLSALRANKPADPFAIDPSISAITSHGVSDPNAGHSGADAGAPKHR
jgi:hypothetical protein